MSRHAWRGGTAALALALLLAGPAATAAPGSPVGSARERAAALRAAVDQAQLNAEQASEAYDETQDRLAHLVTAQVAAARRLAAARAAAANGDQTAARRVRAMYEAGGSVGLFGSLLDGTDFADVLTRYHAVRTLVATDARTASAAGTAVAAAARAQAQVADLTRKASALERARQDQGRLVAEQLARQRGLLANADAEVVRLADAERAAQQAAAARAFQARLALAQRAAAQDAVPHSATSPEATAGALPAGTSAGATALALATTQLGKPYLWGAEGPDAFDCSGLTSWAYAKAGHPIGRTSRQQWYDGPHIALADLAPGDLLFWASNTSDAATIHHVAIYAGNAMMIAAPHAGTLVSLQPVYLTGYTGAVRPAP